MIADRWPLRHGAALAWGPAQGTVRALLAIRLCIRILLPLRRAALANRQGATCKRPEDVIVRPAIGLHCLARAMWHLALLALALVGRVRSAIQDAQEDGCPDPGTEKVSREHGLLAHSRELPQIRKQRALRFENVRHSAHAACCP